MFCLSHHSLPSLWHFTPLHLPLFYPFPPIYNFYLVLKWLKNLIIQALQLPLVPLHLYPYSPPIVFIMNLSCFMIPEMYMCYNCTSYLYVLNYENVYNKSESESEYDCKSSQLFPYFLHNCYSWQSFLQHKQFITRTSLLQERIFRNLHRFWIFHIHSTECVNHYLSIQHDHVTDAFTELWQATLKSLRRHWNSKWEKHAYQVSMKARSGTEIILRASDWLMRSELGYFACSLISGIKDDAATF